MEIYSEFLKQFSIRELKDAKDKPYWCADKNGTLYCTTLSSEAMAWTLRNSWTSSIARTYHDDKGKWWVGEKGSRKGFKTEQDARKHQSKLISKYS